jgi:hypothetical protein
MTKPESGKLVSSKQQSKLMLMLVWKEWSGWYISDKSFRSTSASISTTQLFGRVRQQNHVKAKTEENESCYRVGVAVV